MSRRLREYAMLLRLKHRASVLSIVIYLAGSPAGVREVVERDELPGLELATFRHLAFSLVWKPYLQLEGEEADEYATLLAAEPNQEVAAMEMTWADKLEHKGRQEGIRAVVLDLLETRFGSVSRKTRRRLEAIHSSDELSRLARRLLTAGSLEELGLGGK
jgi:hypothetical protein